MSFELLRPVTHAPMFMLQLGTSVAKGAWIFWAALFLTSCAVLDNEMVQLEDRLMQAEPRTAPYYLGTRRLKKLDYDVSLVEMRDSFYFTAKLPILIHDQQAWRILVSQVRKAESEGKFKKCLELVDKVLNFYYLALTPHSYGRSCAYAAGDDERARLHGWVLNEMQYVIRAKGAGFSQEQAWEIVSPLEFAPMLQLAGWGVESINASGDNYLVAKVVDLIELEESASTDWSADQPKEIWATLGTTIARLRQLRRVANEQAKQLRQQSEQKSSEPALTPGQP